MKILAFIPLLFAVASSAQYSAYSRHTSIAGPGGGGVPVATGDTRAISEPLFPTSICAQVHATKYIVKTNAVNIDPFNSTCGSTGGTLGTLGCTGGTDFQPSQFAASYSPFETLDNTTASGGAGIQTALNACSPGQAVELVPSTDNPPKLGFVLKPWSLPSGVSIIGDMGIRVFASRNRADYNGTNCGLVAATSNCNPWITAPSTNGSGIYGYFVLDGRGWSSFIGLPTQSFYQARAQAYGNKNGSGHNGLPILTPNSDGETGYGPTMLNLINADNFTLYKTTIKDSGDFGINWKQSDGGTFWGAKILAPYEISNTDGWDPLDSINGTFAWGIVSNGDNHVAIKAADGPAKNLSFIHNQTGAGIAIAIGSATQFGVSNILVSDNVQNGNLFNPQSAGLQIGSSTQNGGLVDTVTFQRDCMMNEEKAIRVYPNYGGDTGSHTPIYHNILWRDITVLASMAPYPTGNSGTYTFQGLSGFLLTGQIDNLVIKGKNQGITNQGSLTVNQYASLYLGPGQVPTSVVNQLAVPPAIGVALTGTPGASTEYPCAASMWKPLVGEMNLDTPTSNNNQSWTGTPTLANPIYLQAMVEPTTAISTRESDLPTASVQFKDNGTNLGSPVALGGDGTFAQLKITSATSGTHVYTATYVGDSNYSAFGFGSITVVVP